MIFYLNALTISKKTGRYLHISLEFCLFWKTQRVCRLWAHTPAEGLWPACASPHPSQLLSPLQAGVHWERGLVLGALLEEEQ